MKLSRRSLSEDPLENGKGRELLLFDKIAFFLLEEDKPFPPFAQSHSLFGKRLYFMK
jgi:hypothetical protein